MKPLMCIISVYRPDLVHQAVHALGALGNLRIFTDRRVGERRRPDRTQAGRSPANDRRRRNIDSQLRTDGFAVVPGEQDET
jgi:hypothetical protein